MGLREKARATFLHSAEHSGATLGRQLRQEELERVPARFR